MAAGRSCWQTADLPDDAARFVRRSAREIALLRGHLSRLDPLLLHDDVDVPVLIKTDVDVGLFQTTDGSESMLAVEGIREAPAFTLYVPDWRRLYVLANDGESVAVGDGDPEGEMAWAAVYRGGQLVASYTEASDGGLV